jgi:hypothetical protein
MYILQMGCYAYGDFGTKPGNSAIEAFKPMSQVVIKAWNNSRHFEDVHASVCTLRCTKNVVILHNFQSHATLVVHYMNMKFVITN